MLNALNLQLLAEKKIIPIKWKKVQKIFVVLTIQNIFKITFLQQPKPLIKNSELQSHKLTKWPHSNLNLDY